MYSARERHVPIRKRYFAGKTRDGCEKAQPGSAAGLPVLSEVLRNPITLQFYSELYTKLYALSPFCFFFSAAFAFLAEGLKKDTILCMPPRYRYVQIKTTAKLKKIYIHMMPAAVSQGSSKKQRSHVPKSRQIYLGKTLKLAANASPVAY